MYTLIGTLLVLGIAVLVHELGHFIIARRNGVRVDEFCIGFPPRILKIKRCDTQYSLGIIPVGGFVKMAGEDPEAVSGAPDEFFSQSVPARIRIALAGPFGNFVCAYACVLIYLWTGGAQDVLHPPVFGTPPSAEVYEKTGVRAGDRIVEVRGRSPKTFSESFDILSASDTWPATLVIERGSGRIVLEIDSPSAKDLADSAVPLREPVVARVMQGSPASKAGLEIGDRITEISGHPISEWSQMQTIVSQSGGETLTFGIIRATEPKTVSLVPEILRQQTETGELVSVGRIGIQSSAPSQTRTYGFWEGLWVSFKTVYGFIMTFFAVLWKLFTGGLSVKLLGGPVGIAQVAGDSLQQGAHQFLMFLGIINANLGFVNLIPFFLVTDGGLILLFGIEALRRRKMSIKGLERWNKLGWAMVLTLLVMATYNDLMIRLELGVKVSRGIHALKEMF